MTMTLEPTDHLDAAPRLDRATCLAAALRRLGIGAGSPLAVLVCPDHAADHEVACAAAAIIGAHTTALHAGASVEQLRASLTEHRGGVLLACGEGVERWQETGVPLRVVGEGAAPGVLWWRLLELQEHTAALAS
jgi:hypothetical protein